MQAEKMTPELKKIYDGLMRYDSVMTGWLNETEKNKEQFKRNPIKSFLSVTGMEKNEFMEMVPSMADKEMLLKQLEEGADFTLDEAKTNFTNGWDMVNLATLDAINMIFDKLFGDGIDLNVPLKSDDQRTDMSLETVLAEFAFTDINGSLANMKMQFKNCTASGILNGDNIDFAIGDIAITFEVYLQQVSLETESGKSLELYLDLKADDAIRNINVDVECDNFLLMCILKEILPKVFEKIVDQIPVNQPYKICTVDIDEETQTKLNWLIPDFASFSGSSVLDKEGNEKKEIAVFAKTLDKHVEDLNLNIEQQFADSNADGTLGIAERVLLGYILPICISSEIEKKKPEFKVQNMWYDETEHCLNMDTTIHVNESGAVVNVKSFKVFSREGGFRLYFWLDGDWGAGMVEFDASGFFDICLAFTRDENGEHLTASVSNPTMDYNIDIPWWEWLLMAAILIILGGTVWVTIWGIIVGVASGIISSIMKSIQENGIDGLSVPIEIPIQWNNLQALDIQTISFSQGVHLSYTMQVDEEKIEK